MPNSPPVKRLLQFLQFGLGSCRRRPALDDADRHAIVGPGDALVADLGFAQAGADIA